MAPADLAIVQGDDYQATVSVFNPDGTPANLTGYTPKAQIRRAAQDTTSIDLGATLNGQSTITLALTNAATANLSGGYVWDLQVTSAGGVVTTLLGGNVSVVPSVTR